MLKCSAHNVRDFLKELNYVVQDRKNYVFQQYTSIPLKRYKEDARTCILHTYSFSFTLSLYFLLTCKHVTFCFHVYAFM